MQANYNIGIFLYLFTYIILLHYNFILYKIKNISNTLQFA